MKYKPGTFLAPILRLQPSQLYISQEKLARVQSEIGFEEHETIPPIPIKILGGEWVITDGHTRTFAAYLAGLERVPVYHDQDELDWDAYRICVAWCKAAGIISVADLRGRILTPEDYEQLWLARCRAMQAELVQ